MSRRVKNAVMGMREVTGATKEPPVVTARGTK